MLGASNEFEDINLLKQVPSSKINDIRRGELFKSGYLSKITAFRIFLNSRMMLVVSLILALGSISLFGYLMFNYRLSQASQLKFYQSFDSAGQALHQAISPPFIETASSTSPASSTASTTRNTRMSTLTSTKTATSTKTGQLQN